MFFKKFEINGFRGIKHLKLENLKDVNLLLGKNNCGKTTILEALFISIGLDNPNLVSSINGFRELQIADTDDLRYIFYNLEFTNELILKTTLYEKGIIRELKIIPSIMHQNEINGKKENIISTASASTMETQQIFNELLFKFNIKEASKSKGKDYSSRFQLTTPFPTFIKPKQYHEKLRGVYLSSTARISENLEKELDEIIENKSENEIIEILKLVEPEIHEIKFGKDRILYDIGIEKLIPANLAGDGLRRVLAIILAIRNAKNGILLIDEIENGLHFSTMKNLWKAILESTKKYKVQIFITTHNYETLKFLNEALQESNKSDRERVNCITLRRNKLGDVNSFNYQYEQFSHAIDYGNEIR